VPTVRPDETVTRLPTEVPTLTKEPTPGVTSPPTPTVELADLEQDMLEAINVERELEGLPALTVDPVLTELARGHAQDMVDHDFRGHVTPDGKDYEQRLKDRGIEVHWFGENWYAGICPEDGIIKCAMDWFMDDPPHRANIMHRQYRLVGIGIAEDDAGGYVVVQDFTEER
jgi:uncharacterized protein YkwD